MCFLQHHVSCDSHLRSHAYIVFLITALSLKQALVCLSDVHVAFASQNILTMASHSGSTVDIWKQLYGTRPSVWHRWPSAKTHGDIHRGVDARYPSKVVFRKWFDEKGKKPTTGALENPRMVLSSQRRYKKRIFEEGIDHSGRGISQGQEGSNEDEVELFGGKQWAHASYMTYEDCSAAAMCNACCSVGTK